MTISFDQVSLAPPMGRMLSDFAGLLEVNVFAFQINCYVQGFRQFLLIWPLTRNWQPIIGKW